MVRYSKVSRRVWGDDKFLSLSGAKPNAQTLWLRLLTAPEQTSIPGVIVARLGGLADSLGWSTDDLRKVFGEIIGKGMARVDERAGLIWLPNATKHNRPESHNVIKAWASMWQEIPDSALKASIYAALVDLTEDLPKTFREVFLMVMPKDPQILPDAGTGTGAGTGAEESTCAPVPVARVTKPTTTAREDYIEGITAKIAAIATDEYRMACSCPQKILRKVAGRLVKVAKGDGYGRDAATNTAEVLRLVRAYYTDLDEWLVNRKHPLSDLLTQRVDKYRRPVAGSVKPMVVDSDG
uniref:Uncharacterized protein n=1 Tax=viral metagenome TaxID=1070528 RepID=A0A6H1ZY38_9ZZZZ